MANDPITLEAETILNKKSVTIIPDILANAGGVVASYYEWLQGKQNESWSEKKVLEKLERKMAEVASLVWKTSKENNISLRLASYYLSLKRLQSAYYL